MLITRTVLESITCSNSSGSTIRAVGNVDSAMKCMSRDPGIWTAALSSAAKPAESASSEKGGSGALSNSGNAAGAGSSSSSASLQPKVSELDLIMGAAEDVSTGKIPDASNKRGVTSVLAPARRPKVFSDAPSATDNRGSTSPAVSKQSGGADQKGGNEQQI